MRLSGSITQSLDWVLGGFYSHEQYPDTFNVLAEAPNGQIVGTEWVYGFTQPTTYEEYAGFGDLTLHLTDRFDIQLGARETHVSYVAAPVVQTGPYVHGGPVTSPSFSADATPFTYLVTPEFKLSPDFMVYARFASGFRSGLPNPEVVREDSSVVPAQSSPDKTENYEIGTKGDFLDHRLTLDASLYYIDWKNIQVSLAVPGAPFTYFANGGDAKSEGVEFSAAVKPWAGMTLAAWTAYDDAVLTQSFPVSSTGYGVAGNVLPDVPRYSGHLSLEQQFPLWQGATGFLGIQASYVDSREAAFTATPARLHMPPYTKTDLRAGTQFNDWTINLYANNVADVRALLNGGTGAAPPYGFAYITPRTYGVNVTKQF